MWRCAVCVCVCVLAAAAAASMQSAVSMPFAMSRYGRSDGGAGLLPPRADRFFNIGSRYGKRAESVPDAGLLPAWTPVRSGPDRAGPDKVSGVGPRRATLTCQFLGIGDLYRCGTKPHTYRDSDDIDIIDTFKDITTEDYTN